MGKDALAVGMSMKSGVAVEIESLLDLFVCCCLVDTDISDVAQQGKVNVFAHILLVVLHQGNQSLVVFAVYAIISLVLTDIPHSLSHDVCWKPCLDATQIQFAD